MNALPTTAIASAHDIDVAWHESEVARLDAEIAALIQTRTAAVQHAAAAAFAAGQPRSNQRHELAAMRRFEAVLGHDGVALAMTLMRMARGAAVRHAA